MSAPDSGRVVRLWWRWTLCRRRFDTFGRARDDPGDVRAAAWEALHHFDTRHGRHLDTFDESAAVLGPAGATTRAVGRELLRPFRATNQPAQSDTRRPAAPLAGGRASEAGR